jgi:hypothetical protein
MKNPISFEQLRLVYDECFLISDDNKRLFKKLGPYDEVFSELSLDNHMRIFNIINTLDLSSQALSEK